MIRSTIIKITFCAALTTASFGINAQTVLSGDAKLSCEAILCLASGKRPGECNPSIQRYYSIRGKKARDTWNARRAFLSICPKGPTTPLLESLLDAQSTAGDFCDPELLNRFGDPRLNLQENGLQFDVVNRNCGTGMWCVGERQEVYVSNVLPPQCAALANHPWAHEVMPRYVGTPDLFGRWVRAEDYPNALATYNASLPSMIENRARRDEEMAAAAREAERAGGGK